METPEYETVWSGGEGLTTVGAQRPGVVVTVRDGYVADWVELVAWRATHKGLVRNFETGGYMSERVLDDTRAGIAQPLYRWLRADTAARWSRTVRYSRMAGWPYCSLCGLWQPLADSRRSFQRSGQNTPYHRGVCQSCYVRYRVARHTWPGATRWHASRLRLTEAEKADRRRVIQARYDAKRRARRQAARLAQYTGVVSPQYPDPHTA